MLQNVKQIVVKQTQGDEFGIYRETKERQLYLLFVYDTEDQTTHLGEKLSRLLDRPFVNRFFGRKRDKKKEKTLSSFIPKKKVMGISKMCEDLVKAGEEDDNIVELLLPRYLAVGQTAKKGTERILDTLYYIRGESRSDK